MNDIRRALDAATSVLDLPTADGRDHACHNNVERMALRDALPAAYAELDALERAWQDVDATIRKAKEDAREEAWDEMAKAMDGLAVDIVKLALAAKAAGENFRALKQQK